MSMPDVPTRGPARSGPYIVAGVLLAVAVIIPLIPPAYSFAEPRWVGIPFFYWYQMLWVPITAGLVGISYRLVTKEDRRRREAVRGVNGAEEGR